MFDHSFLARLLGALVGWLLDLVIIVACVGILVSAALGTHSLCRGIWLSLLE